MIVVAGHYVKTDEEKTRDEYEKLWSIIYQRAVHLRGNAMMYYKNEETKEYDPVPSIRTEKSIFSTNPRESITSRGKHEAQVALITLELVKRLGGDERAALLMSLGHDFGHSTLAHTGEAPIGRFMLSPDEFKPWNLKEMKARNGFDHSKHSLKALKKRCRMEGIELSDFIANGIEAHSSGSAKKSSVAHKSLEAECVMRADKIASAISDTRDMILAGVLYKKDATPEEKAVSLEENLNQNKEVRNIIRQRLFPSTEMARLEYIIEQVGGRDAYESELELLTGELSENYIMYSKQDIETMAKRAIEERVERKIGKTVEDTVEEKINKEIDEYLIDVKSFIENEPNEQREKLISAIVETTLKENGGSVKTGYVGEGYVSQLRVPPDVETILGALRGLLIGKEKVRTLGKEGAEVEGLVETIARYIYAHPSEFEEHELFQYWKTDENGEKCDWKETVAYSLTELTDMEFKSFAISLLEREEVREVLKHCKYRDPRDEELEKTEKEDGRMLEYSEADFSTKEAIEAAFVIDGKREYRPSISERRGSFGPGEFGR